MWSDAVENTRHLNAIWNSKKKLQKNYKRVLQNRLKRVTIWLQKERGSSECEIFFFLFLRYRVSGILLRLFSFTAAAHTAQAVSRFVCKKARLETDEFFCNHFSVRKTKIKRIGLKSVGKVLLYPDFLYKLTVFPQSIFTKFVLYSSGICGII